MELAEGQFVGAGLRDGPGAGDRLLGVQASHLVAGLQPVLVVGPGGVGRREGDDAADAVEHLVHDRVGALDVVDVVGGHDRSAELRRDLEEDPVAVGVARLQVVGNLDGEAGTEDLPPSPSGVQRLLAAPESRKPGHLTPQAAGQGDEALGAAGNRLEAGAGAPSRRQGLRPLVEVHLGDEVAEVGPAPGVPGEQDRVVALAPLQLRAEDRPDPDVPAGLAETDCPVHAVVVGEGEGPHPHLGGPGGEVLHPGGPLPE